MSYASLYENNKVFKIPESAVVKTMSESDIIFVAGKILENYNLNPYNITENKLCKVSLDILSLTEEELQKKYSFVAYKFIFVKRNLIKLRLVYIKYKDSKNKKILEELKDLIIRFCPDIDG